MSPQLLTNLAVIFRLQTKFARSVFFQSIQATCHQEKVWVSFLEERDGPLRQCVLISPDITTNLILPTDAGCQHDVFAVHSWPDVSLTGTSWIIRPWLSQGSGFSSRKFMDTAISNRRSVLHASSDAIAMMRINVENRHALDVRKSLESIIGSNGTTIQQTSSHSSRGTCMVARRPSQGKRRRIIGQRIVHSVDPILDCRHGRIERRGIDIRPTGPIRQSLDATRWYRIARFAQIVNIFLCVPALEVFVGLGQITSLIGSWCPNYVSVGCLQCL